MKKHLLSAVSFGLATFLICGATQAQPQGGASAQTQYASGANAPNYGVAVVDISYLFQENPRFKAALESLKAEMQKADASLTTQREAIVNREKQRDEFNPGTAEFKRLDEQIAREKAEFNIQAGTLRRDIAEKESQVYFRTYQEVSNAISTYARSNRIGLVLRFVGDPVDPTNQKDIMRAVTQPIVFQDNIDITPHIRDILATQAGQRAAAQPQASRPVRRQ